MSKYQNIANDLEKAILAKKYIHRLPEQQELAQKYNTSRVTISHALKILCDKKIVKTVKGHGTFIANKSIPPIFLNDNESEIDRYLAHQYHQNETLQSHIVTFDIRYPTATEAKALNINDKDKVYDIIRQRIFKNKPLRLEYTIMPVNRIPGINIEVLHNSVYAYIKKNLGLKFGKVLHVINADKADAYDIKYLDCMENDPILNVYKKSYLSDGLPFEVAHSRSKYGHGSLVMENDHFK